MEKKMEKKSLILIISAFLCCNNTPIIADPARDILIPTAVGAGIGGIAGGGRGAGYGALGGLAVGSILSASRSNRRSRSDNYEDRASRNEEERRNLMRQTDRLEERVGELEQELAQTSQQGQQNLIDNVRKLRRDIQDLKYDVNVYNGSKWRRYYKRLDSLERNFRRLRN